MTNNKKKLLLILLIASKISFPGLGRDDFDWMDYQDFGLNIGKFEIGRKNIFVYKNTDGKVSKIELPMPNFDGASNPHNIGGSSMWDDPQIVSSVTHVIAANGIPTKASLSYLDRHLRTDVNLYSNYKTNIRNKRGEELKKLSDSSETNHIVAVGDDYAFLRLNHILHDSIIYESYKDEAHLKELIKEGTIIARTGSGLNAQVINDKITESLKGYNFAGGLNKISSNLNGNAEKETYIHLNRTEKTAFDIGTMAGDSGSLVLAWDAKNEKWIAVLNNSSGLVTNTWGKWSRLLASPKYMKEFKEKVTATEITETNNVKFEGGKLNVNGKIVTFDNSDIKNNKLLDTLPSNGNAEINPVFFKLKNQIFDAKDLVITVNGTTDTSVSRLEFKKDTTIKGNGTLKTAGFVVHDGAKLTYEAPINQGNTIRKIGDGTLEIKGSSKNEGDINVGGLGKHEIEKGLLLLNNSGGYAAKNIRLAQGATVRLVGDNQLNKNNIYFGLRGGFLDLYGKNLEFSDIYHVDKGAHIINTKNDVKSTFTFNSNDSDVTFLGSFKQNIDVKYAPTENIANWKLRGEQEFKTLDIENGTVSLGGDVITHAKGREKIVFDNEFTRTKFKIENINVKSTLEVNRASEVESNISIKENAKLNVIALGKVDIKKDEKPAYEDAPKEMEINKIVFKNTVEFKDGNSKNLTVNTENNHEVDFDAKITGSINSEKLGKGILRFNSDENKSSGDLLISGGIVELKKEDTLKDVKISIQNNSILRVDNIETTEKILSKLDKGSVGVLSLGNNLSNIAASYEEFSNLYLGSNKSITIGNDGVKLTDSITKLKLGGDGGTVTLKGLDLSPNIKDITIGDEVNNGKVIIDGVKEDADFILNIKKGVELEIINNKSENKFIDLKYGGSLSYSNKALIKDESEGVLLLSEGDINPVAIPSNAYVGANKNTTVNLSSINTGDSYKLSGFGTTNVNFDLDTTKSLTVDAQYLDAGTVIINTSNENYKNEIKVLGNRDNTDENKGSITLKLGGMNALGIDNNFTIKNGGILDLNSKDISLKIDRSNNKYGSIINSEEAISILTLKQDSNLVLNNKVSGNIRIIKVGAHNLELKNEENAIKELDVTEGKLLHNTENTLNDAKVILRENTKMDVTVSLGNKTEINLDGGDLKFKNTTKSSINGGIISLSKDSTITGVSPAKTIKRTDANKRVIFEKLVLNNKKLTFDKVALEVKDFDKNDNNISEIILNDSVYSLRSNSARLTKDKLSKLIMKNSSIQLKDFGNDPSKINLENLTKIVVNGENNRITSGDEYGNDGADIYNSQIYNPIEITENSTLRFMNNLGRPHSIVIGSEFSGKGNVSISGDYLPSQKFIITNNSPKFEGTLIGLINEQIFEINKENEEDRTINFAIIGGNFVNNSKYDLGFSNLSNYSGNIRGNNGGIILVGEKGINSSAKISLSNGKNLTLKNNEENIASSEKDLNFTLSENSKLIKEGIGKVHLGENVIANNVKNIEINKGELSLSRDISVKDDSVKYTIADDAKLNLTSIKEDLNLSNVENNGTISINDTNLNIKNYVDNGKGKFDIHIENINTKLLSIENTKNDAKARLTFNENVLSKIKNEKEEHTVANLKTDLDILNLNDYSALYGLNKRKDGDNVILYSYIEPKNSNLLYILNELNDLLEVNSNAKFKKDISINIINQSKKDLESSYSKDASYKNSIVSSGIELKGEYNKNLAGIDFSIGLMYKDITNNIKSDVIFENENKIFNRKFISRETAARLASKYKDFGIELEISQNGINIYDEQTLNIRYLKNRLSLLYTPKFSIKDDIKLGLNNYISYLYTPIISENISEKDENISKISLKNPHHLVIKSGLSLENKDMKFGIIFSGSKDFSELSISNAEEKVENLYKKGINLDLGFDVSIKTYKDLNLNVSGKYNLFPRSYKQGIFNFGMSYTW